MRQIKKRGDFTVPFIKVKDLYWYLGLIERYNKVFEELLDEKYRMKVLLRIVRRLVRLLKIRVRVNKKNIYDVISRIALESNYGLILRIIQKNQKPKIMKEYVDRDDYYQLTLDSLYKKFVLNIKYISPEEYENMIFLSIYEIIVEQETKQLVDERKMIQVMRESSDYMKAADYSRVQRQRVDQINSMMDIFFDKESYTEAKTKRIIEAKTERIKMYQKELDCGKKS